MTLNALLPQTALAGSLVGILALGAFRRTPAFTLRGLTLAALGLALTYVPEASGSQWIVWDGATRLWTALFLAGAMPLAALLPAEDEVPFALVLAAVLGMTLIAVSRNLLGIFLGLELMSLPAYLLVYSLRKTPASLEAAVKYFFAGGTAAALFLLGLAVAYATRGTLDLSAAGASGLALALMGAAALFKLGAFPLHFWLPDVYEAARPELAGFLSTAMKAAAVLLLMRLVSTAPGSHFAQALPVVAAATMTVGNLLALRQTSLPRLLAYSSISHAGYLLLGVAAWAAQGGRWEAAGAVLFYLFAYLAMNTGVFAALRQGGLVATSDLKGLSQRHPALAVGMTVMLVSLAGLPPTAGFLAKLLVFWEAVKAGLTPWVVVAALNSIVGLAYYFRLVRMAWFETSDPPPSPRAVPEGADVLALASLRAPRAGLAGDVVLWACALPTLALGLMPQAAAWLGELLWRY